ncbi:MAG: hypothetical protein IMF01_09320 [Proteobacteria bacterium]|nr:hypothetical protein [Pseudomonadota bacterium]
MAMTKESMAAKIIAKIETLNPGVNHALYISYWEKISEGIIEEITANMEITTTVQVPGVQTGGSTVTGTGEDVTIL